MVKAPTLQQTLFRMIRHDGALDFKLLFESQPSLCLVLKPDFTILGVTESYLRATMTERDKILGRGIFDVFPDNPDDPKADGVRNLRASLERVLRDRKPDTMAVQKYDIRKKGEEGFEERYWSPLNAPVLGERGEVLYIIHRAEDVTEFVRLKQEKAAREAAEIGGPIPQDVDAEIYLRAQEIQERSRRLEEERMQLERELWQSQKMESLGQLTGGMAHDFNNILGLIIGNLDMMEDKVAPEAEELRQSSIQAVTRGADLIRALLAFSRQQPLNPSVFNANDRLNSLAKLLQRTLGEQITLEVKTGEDLWPVQVDAVQLDAAITNLAINARDAMSKGGKLTITTTNVILDEEYVEENRDVLPGPYVCVEVTDNGCGISPEVLARVFEPFFTTKEPGKGTGLGLAMVYGFIKQSKGHIKIYSEPGYGTSIRLYLPQYMGPYLAAENKVEGAPAVGGSERILVVEDNPDMRLTAIRQMESLGYSVVAAANGREAIDLIGNGVSYDLLCSDVVMPGNISGFDVARASLSRYPNIPVLLTSGFPGAAMEEQREVLPGHTLELLSKPYRKNDLAKKLREMLDKKGKKVA